MSTVYLNAASHGLPSAETLTRMRDFAALEAQIGPLAAAEQAADEVMSVDRAAADLIGAKAKDVAVASTTTASWVGLAIRAVKPGQKVLVAAQEWGDNIRVLKTLGAQVIALPLSNDLSPWQDALQENVAAICVPLVSSISGAHLPVEKLGALPRPEGCADRRCSTSSGSGSRRCYSSGCRCRGWHLSQMATRAKGHKPCVAIAKIRGAISHGRTSPE